MTSADSLSSQVASLLGGTGDEERSLAADLADGLERASALLLTEETVAMVLELLATLAVETLEEPVGAGFTVTTGPSGLATVAATHELVARADALQYELQEGPCLDALASREVQRVDDLSGEARWPRWTAAAQELGLGAVLNSPLVAGDSCLGAVKVYAARPGVFDARTEHLLKLFAAQASVLLAAVHAQRRAAVPSEDLRVALRQRDIVNQAKGILMHSSAVDDEGAFALLVAASQRQDQSVYEVADALVAATVRRRR